MGGPGRRSNFPWEKSRICSCGKAAEFKAVVSIYPLGVKPRRTRSGNVIPVCAECVDVLTKDVAGSLAIGLGIAHKRLLEAA